MTNKYLGVEKYIFSDAYNLFLKYKDIDPNNDYYWECCVADAKLLTFKYHDYPFARELVLSVLGQLEFKLCNKTLSNKTYEEWEHTLGNYREAKPFSPKTFSDKL